MPPPAFPGGGVPTLFVGGLLDGIEEVLPTEVQDIRLEVFADDEPERTINYVRRSAFGQEFFQPQGQTPAELLARLYEAYRRRRGPAG